MENTSVKNVLGDNIGEIELVDYMGSDLSVVNAARVSFGNKKEVVDSSDRKLIDFLARNNHSSPFRHSFVSFRILAPEFTLRQWYKHVIGCSWLSPEFHNHGWNEISGRYVNLEHKFYMPKYLRGQSKDNKQASEGVIKDSPELLQKMQQATEDCYKTYKMLLDSGVAKEQARMILPFNLYVEVIWTTSLQAVAHFCKLRDHVHAQEEIRGYAKAISSICKDKFPVSWEALKR